MYNSGDAAEQVVRMSLEALNLPSKSPVLLLKIWPPPFTRF